MASRRKLISEKVVLLLYIYLLFFVSSFGTRRDRSLVDLLITYNIGVLRGQLLCRRYSVVKGVAPGVNP